MTATAAPAALASKLVSRRDLEFLLFDWLDAAGLCARPRFAEHSRETFDAVLDLALRIATERFADHNRKADENEPRLVDGAVVTIPEVRRAVQAFADAGLVAAAQDAALGGMQLPYVVTQAAFAHFDAANVGTAAYLLLTMANANVLATFGTPAQRARYVPHLLAGRFLGTMCLSEPQAGSSLADIRTRAEPQADGTWRIFGSKMWISGGDHALADNIVHLVLAKIPGAPPGVKGISLFVVPKRRVADDGTCGEPNDVAVAGLNHKMGWRGTANCALNFGERGGAWAELVGEPNRGLEYMFQMMNEARIGIGLGAVMLGYTGYLHALDYARGRPQGRPLSAKDPTTPQVPIVAHADVRRMLLAQKAYVEGGLALALYCARLVDEEKTADAPAARAEARLALEILTPIAKSWPSQWCLAANDLAIQVHGGYGYTRDYPVEQFWRDNRLNPIHEGTHGIQALDLLGRKTTLADGAAFTALVSRIDRTATAALGHADADLRGWGEALAAARAALAATTAVLNAERDPETRLANASVYLELAGHVVIAWMWLAQALVATDALGRADPADAAEIAFLRGKLQACRWFFAWELPRTGPQHALLRALDPSVRDMQDAWF